MRGGENINFKEKLFRADISLLVLENNWIAFLEKIGWLLSKKKVLVKI